MGSNFTLPWPLLRPEQPVMPLSPEIVLRIEMHRALVESGSTLERLLFARFRLAALADGGR